MTQPSGCVTLHTTLCRLSHMFTTLAGLVCNLWHLVLPAGSLHFCPVALSRAATAQPPTRKAGHSVYSNYVFRAGAPWSGSLFGDVASAAPAPATWPATTPHPLVPDTGGPHVPFTLVGRTMCPHGPMGRDAPHLRCITSPFLDPVTDNNFYAEYGVYMFHSAGD